MRSEISKHFPIISNATNEKKETSSGDSESGQRTFDDYLSEESFAAALAAPSGSLISEWGQKTLQDYLAESMPKDALAEVPPSMDLLESASEVNHGLRPGFYRISEAISVDSSLVVKKSSVGSVLKGKSSEMLSGLLAHSSTTFIFMIAVT